MGIVDLKLDLGFSKWTKVCKPTRRGKTWLISIPIQYKNSEFVVIMLPSENQVKDQLTTMGFKFCNVCNTLTKGSLKVCPNGHSKGFHVTSTHLEK